MKNLSLLMCIIILACFFTLPAFAQEGHITINVDGLGVSFDTPPLLDNGRTLVPFRAIAEALNVSVVWDEKTRMISAVEGGVSVMLQINSNTAYRNNVPIPLDTSPQLIGGRTLIPLRFFSEAYNCQVAWDSAKSEVTVISPPRAMNVFGFYALGDSKTSSWEDLFVQPYPENETGNTDLVSHLALGWYSLDRDGTLLTKSRTGWQRPVGWEDVLETAKQYNLLSEMVVHVTDGDQTIRDLLDNETAMLNAALAITEEAIQFQGVNLDFEGLGFQDEGQELLEVQDRFTTFVQILAQRLKIANRSLTLTLHAPNSAYQGYNYKALGGLADQIIIMAYDYGSKPEPVSLVKQAVEMAASLVPSEKLYLGISAPSESGESITTKVGIAKQYRLGGIALWRLGLVTDEMWKSLRQSIQSKEIELTEIDTKNDGNSSFEKMTNEKTYYFDLALEKRFDHLPEISEGESPDLRSLLMNAYFRRNGYWEHNEMTKEYVEKVAKDNFAVENISHASTKEWKLNGDIYTPTGWSYSSACFYDLKEVNSYRENSKTIYEAKLDEYSFPEYEFESIDFTPNFAETYSPSMMYVIEKKGNEIKSGMSTIDGIKDLIIQGDTDNFNRSESLMIKYYLDEATGNMVFVHVER